MQFGRMDSQECIKSETTFPLDGKWKISPLSNEDKHSPSSFQGTIIPPFYKGLNIRTFSFSSFQ